MPSRVIKIPERGSIDLSGNIWSVLALDSHFWSLAARGIFSVEQRAAGITRLSGGCFVGRAILAREFILELEEKIPGSLASLLGHASRVDFRLQSTPSPSSALGPLIELLAQQFVDVASRYAGRGRDFSYRRIKKHGSLIGGKLCVTGTARLHARGLRHLAEFEKNVISFDTPLNRIVLAALRELESIRRVVSIGHQTVERSRALAVLFSDCRNTEVLFGLRSSLVQLAAAQQEKSVDPLIRDLMSLAGVILSHESFEHSGQLMNQVPRSWFLNLEHLFEAAVRNLLGKALGNRATVLNGRSSPTSIFALNPLGYKAHPDMVIRTADGLCIIGDAKFKLAQDTAAPTDMYQLLVHASAFGAKTAFLVYPHDSFRISDQGVAVTGTRVYLCGVQIDDLGKSMEALASIIRSNLAPSLTIPDRPRADASNSDSGPNN